MSRVKVFRGLSEHGSTSLLGHWAKVKCQGQFKSRCGGQAIAVEDSKGVSGGTQ